MPFNPLRGPVRRDRIAARAAGGFRRPAARSAVTGLGIAALAAVLGAFGPARAQVESRSAGGFRIGIELPLGRLGASMQKTVDNTAPNTLVPEPRRGQMFHDQASGEGLGYGLGVAAGYRLPLASGVYYLEGDVGIAWHGGSTEAQFAGVGVSPERKQLGESWPDRWTFERDMSYGATLRLGGGPGGLQARGASLYLLAGVRFAAVTFTNHYSGCFSTEPCDPSEFRSGTEVLDLDFTGWMSGLGLETGLGERTALRAEASYATFGSEEWVTPFTDVGVTVDSTMDADEIGITLSLVRRF